MKKILALTTIVGATALTVTACSCSNETKTMFTVDGFDDLEFSGVENFKEYFKTSNLSTTYDVNESWSIKGWGESFSSRSEAVNKLAKNFQVGATVMSSVAFDDSGKAIIAIKNDDIKTVYKTQTGEWTDNKLTAALSYTQGAKDVYAVNLYGEGQTLFDSEQSAVEAFIAKYVKNVPAKSTAKLLANEIQNGDYVISGGSKFIWNDARQFGGVNTKFEEGASLTLNGVEYKYLNSWDYSFEANKNVAPKYVGKQETDLIGSKLAIADGEKLRVFNRDFANVRQYLSGNNLANYVYNTGVDYEYNSSANKFILVNDEIWAQSNIDKATVIWSTFDCDTQIGTSRSHFPCFTEEDIKNYPSNIYEADPHLGVKYTNVDKYANGFHATAGSGVNATGWYPFDASGKDGFADLNYLRNLDLDSTAIYFEKTNTGKVQSGKMTTNPGDAYFTSRPAGFYIAGYDTTQETNSSNYIAFGDVWAKDDNLAGKRELTLNSSEANITSSEYWYVGQKKYTKYNSELEAQTAARRIAKASLVKKYDFIAGGMEYVSSKSYEEAIYMFLRTFEVKSKFVAASDLNASTNFELLNEFTQKDLSVGVYIFGYEETYFDSEEAAFDWMMANQSELIIKNEARTVYEYRGISTSSIDDLAQQIWDKYSHEKN